MSFESRVKADLETDASVISPDVGDALSSVRRRHETRRRIRMASYSLALAAIVAAGVVGVPRALDALKSDSIGPAAPKQPSTSRQAYSAIAGVYAARIPERPGLVRSYHLAGRWQMSLSASGTIALTAPPDFTDFLGPPEAARFTMTNGRLVTPVLYHQGLGCTGQAIYAWELEGDTLRFTEVDDDCPYRPTVLTSVWRAE